MRKFSVSSAAAAITLCFGIGVICYAVSRIDTAVYVNAVPEDETVIVLDAGHGEYVLSVVI